jgi:toxin ParE1/3/4
VKGFVLTRLARRDLEEIWRYAADDSVAAANQILDHLEEGIRSLAKNPGIGHLREDLADRRHHFYLAGSYLIVYRPKTKPLQIIRILHASRDVQALLEIDTGDGGSEASE